MERGNQARRRGKGKEVGGQGKHVWEARVEATAGNERRQEKWQVDEARRGDKNRGKEFRQKGNKGDNDRR